MRRERTVTPVVAVTLAILGVDHRRRFPHRIAALFTPLPSPWLSSTFASCPVLFCWCLSACGLGAFWGTSACAGTAVGAPSLLAAATVHLVTTSSFPAASDSAAVVWWCGVAGPVMLVTCSVQAGVADRFARLPAECRWGSATGLGLPCASGAAAIQHGYGDRSQ